MAPAIRFYLDENVPVAVAAQLQRRGVDAVTVRDLGLLGDSDLNHLVRATHLGYILCTNDADYVDFAMSGIKHAATSSVNSTNTASGIGSVFWNYLPPCSNRTKCVTGSNISVEH